MRITIEAHELPGRRFVSEGVPLGNVHVGVQIGKEPAGLTPGDAPSARWDVDVRTVIADDGAVDLRGPAVHGKRGERFLYLTWGEVGDDGSFSMFRRAKLMACRHRPGPARRRCRRRRLTRGDDRPDGRVRSPTMRPRQAADDQLAGGLTSPPPGRRAR